MRVAGQIYAKVNDDPLPTSPLTPLRAPAAPRLASTPNAPMVRSLMAEATAPSPVASPATRRVLRFSSPPTPTPSRLAPRYSTARNPIIISSNEESDAGEDDDVFEGFDERASPPIKEEQD
ncbi:hypothetical protein HRR83_007628 [Exophiala dermatitidis]|nr:hypothetical protein HRR74_007133 [Exophiala dermatitidis]KAJ4521766.1 hypothetical protein HRR73_002964 [Exophiala dermatitidis]KAJ4539460.1 hypothetical protein HRR77_006344 [Exophiala dermatitidis]KAJ4548459.1 hypothetical protein HRR76_001058 [Exophiala dermatitidis]KAJ4562882.1 hypothetical protein HRR79_006478 [Exophiala dermatitidis]